MGTLTFWVLIVVSRVYVGVSIDMHEFSDKAACETAATAIRRMTPDASDYGVVRTWCVPKTTGVKE